MGVYTARSLSDPKPENPTAVRAILRGASLEAIAGSVVEVTA